MSDAFLKKAKEKKRKRRRRPPEGSRPQMGHDGGGEVPPIRVTKDPFVEK